MHESIVERLATEVQSRKGRRAILVQAPKFSVAIHHLNKDGTFSAKGPYFISRYTRNWFPQNRTHLVRFLRARKGWGFNSSNPNQDDALPEKGLEVLELDTARYPPASIWDYVELKRKQADGHEKVDP